MGRPRAKLDRLGQADQVHARLKTEGPGQARERLLAVSHGLHGELNLGEIAERVGRSRATIQTWFDHYRQGGIDALCEPVKTKTGPKPALDERGWREFRKKLARGSFRTGEQAQAWIAKRFKVHRSVSTVRRWMGKLGGEVESGSASPSQQP